MADMKAKLRAVARKLLLGELTLIVIAAMNLHSQDDRFMDCAGAIAQLLAVAG